MSPNPLLVMAPTNVQTAAIQGSPVNQQGQGQQPARGNMNASSVNGSPRHRKNKRQRDRNTPSPKHHRGSPKPKTSTQSSSHRNYTPPPRFQKSGQLDGAVYSNNFSSIFMSESSMSMSNDENSNDSTKETTYAGAKFHSEAPRPEDLPLPPSNWLIGCFQQATPGNVNLEHVQTSNDYHEQLTNELKNMLKVAM